MCNVMLYKGMRGCSMVLLDPHISAMCLHSNEV